jgi:hypothetical protein
MITEHDDEELLKARIMRRIVELGREIDNLHSTMKDYSADSIRLLSEINSDNFKGRAEGVKINLDVSEHLRRRACSLQSLKDNLPETLRDYEQRPPNHVLERFKTTLSDVFSRVLKHRN